MKCDRLYPCTRCQKLRKDCVFHCSASQQSRLNIAEENSILSEACLQPHPISESIDLNSDKRPRESSFAHLSDDEESALDDDEPAPEDEKDLEPTTLVRVDASYRNDVDDDVLDLGIKIGKMRMNERLGGLFRPGIHDEVGS